MSWLSRMSTSLTPNVQEPLAEILTWVAGSKHRLAGELLYWCPASVNVETDIALVGMALEEEGHSLVLQGFLQQFCDRPQTIQERIVSWDTWRLDQTIPTGLTSADTWQTMILQALAADSLMSASLAALSGSPHQPLTDRLTKMMLEEQFHLAFALESITALAAASSQKGVSRPIKETVRATQRRIRSQFTAEPHLIRLASAGFLPSSWSISHDKLLSTVDSQLEETTRV